MIIKNISVVFYFGNRNRQGIPLKKEIKKLICLSKAVYERLKEAVGVGFKHILTLEKKINVYQREVPPSDKIRRQKLIAVNNSDYEPSNIWETRESKLWQWRRVREWFSQLNELDFPLEVINSLEKSRSQICFD